MEKNGRIEVGKTPAENLPGAKCNAIQDGKPVNTKAGATAKDAVDVATEGLTTWAVGDAIVGGNQAVCEGVCASIEALSS